MPVMPLSEQVARASRDGELVGTVIWCGSFSFGTRFTARVILFFSYSSWETTPRGLFSQDKFLLAAKLTEIANIGSLQLSIVLPLLWINACGTCKL